MSLSPFRLAVAALVLSFALPATAQPRPSEIRLGQSVSGTLDASGPTYGWRGAFSIHRFEAQPGVRYVADAESGDFDTYLLLFRETGGLTEVVGEDDDGGDGTNARLRFTTEHAGTHLLVVQAYAEGEGGAYTLRLAEREPLTPAVPQPLTVGQSVRGTITDASGHFATEWDDEVPYDLYTFDARSGEQYLITLDSDDFDSYLDFGAMFGDQFDVRESNDDGGDGLNSRLVARIPARGTYAVRARPLGASGRGAYTLRVEPYTPPEPQRSTLRVGQTVSGALSVDDATLESGSFYQVWAFEGRAGQSVTVSLTADDFDTYLSLGRERNGTFEELAFDDDGGEGLNSRLEFTLPDSGTYVIHARSFGAGATGAYTLSVE